MPHHRRVAALIVLVGIGLSLGPALSLSARAAPDAAVRLRIGVTADGIYRVTHADLASAGLDPATVDPATSALSSLGGEIALRVVDDGDGSFGQGEYLEFFGQRFRGPEMEQKYTDERVYWLDFGGSPGARVAEQPAIPQGNLTPPDHFPSALHIEENLLWWPLNTIHLNTEDTWYWTKLQPNIAIPLVTVDLPATVPDPAGGTSATLRLEEVAKNYGASNPDHFTTIALNDFPLGNQAWDGRIRQIFAMSVPPDVLVHGSNTVKVGAQITGTIISEWVYANYWELDYRRLFRAYNGLLDFAAEGTGTHEYAVGGWASDQVEIWDVSDPGMPKYLTGASPVQGGGEWSHRFRADDVDGVRYWMQDAATIVAPASIRLRPPTGLDNPPGGADVVIVTDPSLEDAATALAGWHNANGRRAIIAFFQDVCDEFNEGIYHPKAVPAMLSHAQANWVQPGPAYLTLLGDGHWNFKGYNPADYPAGPNPVPPYLAIVDPWQGEVPADAYYGDLDGDRMPDLAVGRIPVNTLAEAQAVIAKIIAYDQGTRLQPWQRSALFVADNADVDGDFPARSDQIIASYLPWDLIPQRVYLKQTVPDADAARAAIAAAINSGVWMVQYAGHGSLENWAQESIWHVSDVASLHNVDQYPVVMTFNCLDGYFADPRTQAMAEVMLRHPGGGSVAGISPTGLGLTIEQHLMREKLMTAMFQNDVREIGQALLEAKRQYRVAYGAWNYLIATVMLYGDPAMRLPQGKHWRYLPLAAR